MTSDGLPLFAYAQRGVEHACPEGYGITKDGVMLKVLMERCRRPRTLFEDDGDDSPAEKHPLYCWLFGTHT